MPRWTYVDDHLGRQKRYYVVFDGSAGYVGYEEHPLAKVLVADARGHIHRTSERKQQLLYAPRAVASA